MYIKPSLALFCIALSCTPAMADLTPDAARVIDRAILSAAQIKEYAAEVVHIGPPQQQMAISSAPSSAATATAATAAAPGGPSPEQRHETLMYRAPGYLWISSPMGSTSRILRLADGKLLYRFMSHSSQATTAGAASAAPDVIDAENLGGLSDVKLKSHPELAIDDLSPLLDQIAVLDGALADPKTTGTLLRQETFDKVLCDVVELKGSFNPRGMRTSSRPTAGAAGAPEITSVRVYFIGADDGLIRRIIATTEINGVAGPSTETRYTLGKADPASAFTFERLAAAVKPLIGDNPFPEVRTSLNDIGQPLPEVGGKLVDGKDLRWQDFHGKVLVVETWATWCTFCKHAMPYYEKVRKQLAGKDVVFVQLNFEEKEALYEKWVRDNSGKYGFIFARGEMTAQNWQEKLNRFKGSLPGFYVVGRDGRIVAAYRGFGYGDGGEDPRLIPALEKAGIQVQAQAGEASTPGP